MEPSWPRAAGRVWIAYAAEAYMLINHDLEELLESGDAFLLGLAKPELDSRFADGDLKTWPLPKLLMYLGSMSQAIAERLPNMALQDEVSDSTARLVAIAVTAGERAIAGLTGLGEPAVEFATFAHWLIWRYALDMAPFRAPSAPAPGLLAVDTAVADGHLALHGFLADLYADMLRQPEAYGIPADAYSPCDLLLPEADQAARQPSVLRARKAIIEGVLAFLYQLGQRASVADGALTVDRVAYTALAETLDRHADAEGTLRALAGLGLAHSISAEQATFTSPTRQGLTTALASFSRACSANAENGFYAFRRGDFAGYDPAWAPNFADAVAFAPAGVAAELTAVDDFMRQLGLKRTVQTEATAGYRIKYERSKHKLAYWIRVWTPFHPPVYHRLRWGLEPDVNAALFARLAETSPGLAERVFGELNVCTGCRPTCSARRVVYHGGASRTGCLDVGWGPIAVDADGFAAVRAATAALVDIPAQESTKPR